MRMTRSVVAVCLAVLGAFVAPAAASAAQKPAHPAIYWWKG